MISLQVCLCRRIPRGLLLLMMLVTPPDSPMDSMTGANRLLSARGRAGHTRGNVGHAVVDHVVLGESGSIVLLIREVSKQPP